MRQGLQVDEKAHAGRVQDDTEGVRDRDPAYRVHRFRGPPGINALVLNRKNGNIFIKDDGKPGRSGI